jgi:hypothetical protein
MITTIPFATFRLLKDFHSGGEASLQLSDLRAQLEAVPDLNGATLSPEGNSTVVATLPAINERQKNKLRSLLAKSVRGWKVIDDASYQLPATF